jgi:hypothetical protein
MDHRRGTLGRVARSRRRATRLGGRTIQGIPGDGAHLRPQEEEPNPVARLALGGEPAVAMNGLPRRVRLDFEDGPPMRSPSVFTGNSLGAWIGGTACAGRCRTAADTG